MCKGWGHKHVYMSITYYVIIGWYHFQQVPLQTLTILQQLISAERVSHVYACVYTWVSMCESEWVHVVSSYTAPTESMCPIQ